MKQDLHVAAVKRAVIRADAVPRLCLLRTQLDTQRWLRHLPWACRPPIRVGMTPS